MLWVCPECNRSKSGQSPVVEGVWVLDPTVDDPWAHLALDTSTGLVAPRFVNSDLDARGNATLRLFKALTWEEVIEGRARSIRRMRGAGAGVAVEGCSANLRKEFLRAVGEDEYGVARWFAVWEGQREEPFRALKSHCPELWRRFVAAAMR
jgi:hypothetical protein